MYKRQATGDKDWSWRRSARCLLAGEAARRVEFVVAVTAAAAGTAEWWAGQRVNVNVNGLSGPSAMIERADGRERESRALEHRSC